jgi:hypothetical protein
MKTSLGIWAFGAMATRFNPGGYKPELVGATTVDKVRTAVETPARSGLYPPGLNRVAIAPNAQIPRLVFMGVTLSHGFLPNRLDVNPGIRER